MCEAFFFLGFGFWMSNGRVTDEWRVRRRCFVRALERIRLASARDGADQRLSQGIARKAQQHSKQDAAYGIHVAAGCKGGKRAHERAGHKGEQFASACKAHEKRGGECHEEAECLTAYKRSQIEREQGVGDTACYAGKGRGQAL